MTVLELSKVSQTHMKIMSSYNGKVLCHRFDPEKHKEIGEREVISVWADLCIVKGPFGDSAKAIIRCYAHGGEEYCAEHPEYTEV